MMENQTYSRRLFMKAVGMLSTPLVLFPYSSKGSDERGESPKGKNSSYPGSDPDDSAKIKFLLENSQPNVWLFTGDSITHGAKHTHGYRSYPEIFQERIRWELQRFRDIIINTAISGNAVSDILGDFDWRIGQFKPNVVSLMIGANDVAREGMTTQVFDNNLQTFIGRIRELGAIPVLHTTNPVIFEATHEKRKALPQYMAVSRDVAARNNVVLVDHWAWWEEVHKSFEKNVYRQWLNDPVHPNAAGHFQMARLLFKALNIFDPDAPSCTGEYYEGVH